ncbi:MAG: hypothetical protein ACRDJH_25110, partial [Thermomicrobiales bacterium]
LKTHLRGVAARTFEVLVAAIGDALAAITPADARGFFVHCGFPSWTKNYEIRSSRSATRSPAF